MAYGRRLYMLGKPVACLGHHVVGGLTGIVYERHDVVVTDEASMLSAKTFLFKPRASFLHLGARRSTGSTMSRVGMPTAPSSGFPS